MSCWRSVGWELLRNGVTLKDCGVVLSGWLRMRLLMVGVVRVAFGMKLVTSAAGCFFGDFCDLGWSYRTAWCLELLMCGLGVSVMLVVTLLRHGPHLRACSWFVGVLGAVFLWRHMLHARTPGLEGAVYLLWHLPCAHTPRLRGVVTHLRHLLCACTPGLGGVVDHLRHYPAPGQVGCLVSRRLFASGRHTRAPV